jgi:hypothetical protein
MRSFLARFYFQGRKVIGVERRKDVPFKVHLFMLNLSSSVWVKVMKRVNQSVQKRIPKFLLLLKQNAA